MSRSLASLFSLLFLSPSVGAFPARILEGRYEVEFQTSDRLFHDEMRVTNVSANGEVSGTFTVPGVFMSDLGGARAEVRSGGGKSEISLRFFVTAREGGEEYRVYFSLSGLAEARLLLTGEATLDDGRVVAKVRAHRRKEAP